MTKTSLLTGVGIGYRPVHYRWIEDNRPNVSWFEVITENFLGGGRPRRFLETLRHDYPIVLHGVGLSLAGTEPLHQEYLQRWQKLIHELEPAMISDHLCWTSHNGQNTHDLLPLPYTNESLAHVSQRIQRAQDYIKRPLLIENPSMYIAFAHNDMNEAEFLRELCQSTGCKILLDLNNLFVNHCNLGLDIKYYLDTLPHAAIAQFHLAGHSIEKDVRIDTHDQDICAEVWELYRFASQRWPSVPALLEWDDKIPEFPAMLALRDKAEQIAASGSLKPAELKTNTAPPAHKTAAPLLSLRTAQEALMRVVTSSNGVAANQDAWEFFSDQIPVPRQVGLNVYNQAYFLRIRDCLRDLFPSLYYLCEDDGFAAIVAGYLQAAPPTHYDIKFSGAHFAEFLDTGNFACEFGIPSQVLGDIARIEWAQAWLFDCMSTENQQPVSLRALSALNANDWEMLSLQTSQAMLVVKTTYNALAMIESAHQESTPPEPVAGAFFYLIYRQNDEVRTETINNIEYSYLELLQTGVPLQQATDQISQEWPAAMEQLPELLKRWCERGLITSYKIKIVRPESSSPLA